MRFKKFVTALMLILMASSVVARPIHADDTHVAPLEKTLEQLILLRDNFLENKHYTSRELYEKNRQNFMGQYSKFMEQFRAEYAPDSKRLERNPETRFVDRVANFHQSLLEAKNVIGDGAQRKVEYLFEPEAIMTALPWSEHEIKFLMEVFEDRFGRKLDLSTYVTKPSEAVLIIKFLDQWSSLETEDLSREIHDFGVDFIKVDTDNQVTFNRILDAILHTEDGKAFWIWEYVLKNDKTFYRDSFEICNLALTDLGSN